MRNLTIKREKSFVGCAATMKVYIMDVENGDLVISGDNCRMLGEIKNGEEKTFEIENGETKIYAIADKASREFCNDCYQLSEGEEDVSLSGRCKFNPAAGNAFRFNGNDGTQSTANRKKSVAKGALVLIAAVVIGMLAGYFGMTLVMNSTKNKAKTYVVDEMSITLTSGFSRTYKDGYVGAFGSKEVAVFISKEEVGSHNIILSGFTPEDYAEYIMQINNIDAEVTSEEGLVGFSFTAQGSDGNNYRYYAYVYKHESTHWMVQFSVKEGRASKYEDKIEAWAKSVAFE